MSGQINSNIGISPPQNHSTNEAEQSQNLTASKPGVVNRTSITTYPPQKNLSNSKQSSHTPSTPIANRHPAIKTKGVSRFLKVVEEKIKNLEQSSRQPSAPVIDRQAATNPESLKRSLSELGAEVKKLEQSSPSAPAPAPVADRQAVTKPLNLKRNLNFFGTKIKTLKKESPTGSKEKELHKNQIRDTLKGIGCGSLETTSQGRKTREFQYINTRKEA